MGNKQVNLSPGMNVTVEIKIGTRRLIEYFLTPILRGFKESAREIYGVGPTQRIENERDIRGRTNAAH